MFLETEKWVPIVSFQWIYINLFQYPWGPDDLGNFQFLKVFSKVPQRSVVSVACVFEPLVWVHHIPGTAASLSQLSRGHALLPSLNLPWAFAAPHLNPSQFSCALGFSTFSSSLQVLCECFLGKTHSKWSSLGWGTWHCPHASVATAACFSLWFSTFPTPPFILAPSQQALIPCQESREILALERIPDSSPTDRK